MAHSICTVIEESKLHFNSSLLLLGLMTNTKKRWAWVVDNSVFAFPLQQYEFKYSWDLQFIFSKVVRKEQKLLNLKSDLFYK